MFRILCITANVRGLPQAAESNDTSGGAAQQIYFYLTARPIVCRLAASHMLHAVFFVKVDRLLFYSFAYKPCIHFFAFKKDNLSITKNKDGSHSATYSFTNCFFGF